MLFRGRLMQAFLFAAFNQLPKCAVHDKEYIIYIIGGLQQIPGDPKRQPYGGHVG